jgi:hypothetical protein
MSWFSKSFRKKKPAEESAKDENPSEKTEKPNRSISEKILSLGLSELTFEEEEKLLDGLAKKIHEYGLETIAIIFLESSKPISVVGSQLILTWAAPFLEIVGVKGYDYAALFSKKENVERLLKKIELNIR